MMEAKFNRGDIVRILSNEVQPQYVGRIGRISKVYPSYSEKLGNGFVYRVNVGGKLLQGVARDSDITMITKGENNGKESS